MSKNRKNTSIKPLITPRRLQENLERADNLIKQDKPHQALEILLEMEAKYPLQPDIYGLMTNAYMDIGDHQSCLISANKLHQLSPGNPDTILCLANEYLVNEYPILALFTYRQFVNYSKNDERVKDVQKIITNLESNLSKLNETPGISFENDFNFIHQYEELRFQMVLGKYERCRSLGKSLLEQHPNFTPILNNLSLVAWLDGNLPEGIELGKKVLEVEPDNIHALSNLTRFYFMLERIAESSYYAQLLKQSQAEGSERWVKIVEALSFIGDDEGVLSIREQTKYKKVEKYLDGIFWHWCAVAEYRKGNTTKARMYWKKSLQDGKSYNYAQANLDELQKPLHQRVCPQAYSIDFWLSRKAFESMISVIKRLPGRAKGPALQENINRVIDAYPEIIHFNKQALISGDIECRELALNLAEMSAHPKILADLKEFTTSQLGPDNYRIKASQVLTKNGLLKSGDMIDFWIEGKWNQITMFSADISFEPINEFPLKPGVQQLIEQALNMLHDNNAKNAEMKLRKAIKIQGENPSLLNNLAVALSLQGRNEEAKAIAEELPLRFPDYFFGQVIQIRKALRIKDLERAGKILDKMMEKTELHVSEFSALCACQIDFLIASKKTDGAISWYEIWKQGYPQDSYLEEYKEIMGNLIMMKKYKQGFSLRNRKVKKGSQEID